MSCSVTSVEIVTVMCLSFTLVVVIIVILKLREELIKKPVKTISESPIYLNLNGAYKSFNSSDIAYDEVSELYVQQDVVKMYLRDLFKTSLDSEIVFNSGATESITSCINWFLHYCPYGTIYGSTFDHPTIKETCKFKNVPYKQFENLSDIGDDSDDIVFSESAIVVTTVNPSTGEINSLDYNFLSKFRFVFVDVCQSVGKIPFDSSLLENPQSVFTSLPNICIFFSLHKLNRDHYEGVMIIEDEADKFIPLIYGRQQNNLRGGTYDLRTTTKVKSIIENYKSEFNHAECKSLWNRIINSLEEELKNKPNSNLKEIYKPKTKHLYNTILLTYDKCVMGLIQELSKEKIYVTAKTSCVTIDNYNNPSHLWLSPRSGPKPSQSIRLSFINDPFKNCPEKFDYLIEKLTD